jgi:prephenate dehydrogenase
MLFEHLTIIGVGLMGGAVGLAAKARGVVRRVTGVDRQSRQLEWAAARGAIDGWTHDLAEGVASADLVVVSIPVDQISDVILKAASRCRPGTVFTDVGSTKGNIVAAVAGKLPQGVDYVPAHPLAGSEKTGVENAVPDLFAQRLTVVTPLSDCNPQAVERVSEFWRSLGSRISLMTPDDHDRAVAVTSHLPHLVAATTARVTPRELLALTAGGFRDVTRIAAGDPRLWTAIFQANRESVLTALDAFSHRLSEFRKLLDAGDTAGLVEWLTEAKQVRDALGC